MDHHINIKEVTKTLTTYLSIKVSTVLKIENSMVVLLIKVIKCLITTVL